MFHDKQYLLDLKFPISFQEEDYIVTNSNYLAWKFIKKWPNWGNARLSRIVYIYGEKGSGKSHLSSIWQKWARAKYVSEEWISRKEVFDENNLIIDGIECFFQHEEYLFNLFNHILETGNFLLITASNSPLKLDLRLPDLRSRFAGIFSIEIAKPDDQMIASIITKYFSDAQIPLNNAVIKFLVTRINRSYAEISSVLKTLEKISLSEKRKISIPFIKEVLCDVLSK